jgi:SRSO17 transposase
MNVRALRELAARIKARWICEQAHQQMKEELGLDHFEGRAWHGLHHHALLVMIAYAFLQHLRLAQIRERGRNRELPLWTATPADTARRPRRRRAPAHRRRASSSLPQMPGSDPGGLPCLILPKWC